MRLIKLIIATVFFATSGTAWACSCYSGAESTKELVDAADSVFIGYIETVSQDYSVRLGQNVGESQSQRPQKYRSLTFRVVKFYKGEKAETVTIETEALNNSCAVDFATDTLHVIAAKLYDNGVYTINLCASDPFNGLAIARYFEKGEDIFSPSKDRCYMKIKQAYDWQIVDNKSFTLDPICQYHRAEYDRILGVEAMEPE
jgi:hypothetical protein